VRDLLLARSRSYQSVFSGIDAEAVLADLERFCHANSTIFVEGDSHGTAQLEGRRQVWLRIQGYRNLTDHQIGEVAGQAETEEGE
jgi:hypothetical protein|tara:strand:+ start:547 stop:801 length:255 start_codon:yes stop_codon:yes gene_type:complete